MDLGFWVSKIEYFLFREPHQGVVREQPTYYCVARGYHEHGKRTKTTRRIKQKGRYEVACISLPTEREKSMNCMIQADRYQIGFLLR